MLKFLMLFVVILAISVAASENHFDVKTIQTLYDQSTRFQKKYNFGLINSEANGHFEERFENMCHFDVCYLQYRVSNETHVDDLNESYKIENNEFKTLSGELLRGRSNQFTRYGFKKTDTGFTFNNANYKDTDNVRSFSISNHDFSDNIQTSSNLSNESQSFVNDLISFHRKMIDFLNSLSAEDNHVYYYRRNINAGSIVYIEFRDNENRNAGTISLEVHPSGGIFGVYVYDIRSQSFAVENGKIILEGGVRTTGAY